MECPICYENNVDGKGEMLWLECLHPLCKLCLKKLERKVCTLCRHDIKSEILEASCHLDQMVKPRLVTIRVRERGNRHTDVEELSVIMEETFENASLRKAKRVKRVKRENKKKGRWNDTVRQTFGGRYRQRHHRIR